jgi:hypothetical protein
VKKGGHDGHSGLVLERLGRHSAAIDVSGRMAEKPKPDPNADLHRTLNNACRKWGAREIRLRYSPKPSLNRWIAEALIDHHRVIEKIRADIPAGELTLEDIDRFKDQPIARGVSDTATDAIKTMWFLQWRAQRNG